MSAGVAGYDDDGACKLILFFFSPRRRHAWFRLNARPSVRSYLNQRANLTALALRSGMAYTLFCPVIGGHKMLGKTDFVYANAPGKHAAHDFVWFGGVIKLYTSQPPRGKYPARAAAYEQIARSSAPICICVCVRCPCDFLSTAMRVHLIFVVHDSPKIYRIRFTASLFP